jgi:urease accessory protein
MDASPPCSAVDLPGAALAPAALIQLLWLASPALPVGSFSYSEGLEAAVDSARVHDEATAAQWLLDQQALLLGRAELPLLAEATRAWQRGDAARIADLNDWVLHTRDGAEARQQTLQMGRSLSDWLRQRDDDAALRQLLALAPAPTWPVAFALAAARSGAPLREVLIAFGFGWAENMVQAAVKTVPLGQSAGQRLLARLAEALPEVVEAALHTGDAQRQNFAPVQAILAARHEAQYSRLFRS